MMRSMFSGVSGLRSHQTKMDVIGNNIANVNTVGYKSSRVTFKEVFTQTISGASAANTTTGRGGVNPQQIGLGVSVGSIDNIMTQGAAQRTDVTTDLMIQGDSFFIVGDANGTYFTRNGAMYTDEEGNLSLTGTDGLIVQGWMAAPGVDAEGKPTYTISKGAVDDIQISGQYQYIEPTITSAVDFEGNLNGNDIVKDSSITFYDSLGNLYSMDIRFEMIGEAKGLTSGTGTTGGNVQATEWQVSIGNRIYPAGDEKGIPISLKDGVKGLVTTEDVGTTGTITDKPAIIGSIAFGTDGKVIKNVGTTDFLTGFELVLDTLHMGGALMPTAKLGDASVPSGIKVDLSKLTQFKKTSDATSKMLDGSAAGSLNRFSIGSDGIIVGSYSNGLTRPIAQIAVASFTNPAGLEKIGSNLYSATANSGEFKSTEAYAIQELGGSFIIGSLEMANVDLSAEFTEMITTQRGFQANSRIITTSDELLQELVNLKR